MKIIDLLQRLSLIVTGSFLVGYGLCFGYHTDMLPLLGAKMAIVIFGCILIWMAYPDDRKR